MVFREKGGGGSVVANIVQRADYRKLTADELPMKRRGSQEYHRALRAEQVNLS